MDKIKVLVADDHAIVRTGLVTLLSRAAGIEVVGEASDGAAAIAKAARLLPDVVVMDLVMPKKDGIAATAELHERFPEMKILVLTSFGTSEDIANVALFFASVLFFLLLNQRIEAANCVLFLAVHASAPVQDKNHLRQIVVFHLFTSLVTATPFAPCCDLMIQREKF